MRLRPYQAEALAALETALAQNTGNPLISLPTGSGKSHVIAALIRSAFERGSARRVLVLAHVREIIQQDIDKLRACWPNAPAGILSAGLASFDTASPILFASVQTAVTRAAELGRVDLVVIDEAHCVPKSGEGRYWALIEALRDVNPGLRVCGLTATPFRTRGGLLHRGEGRLFTDVVYEADLLELVRAGFLSPLVARATDHEIDVGGVSRRGGEFVLGELERAADVEQLVEGAAEEIVELGIARRSWLVFCVGCDHARHVLTALRKRGVAAELVLGDSPEDERDQIVEGFRAGQVRALVNCNVLTTGFDAPATDLIALMRPTWSAGLYTQMVGRGMRPAPGKADCLVLDFGGNVARHGPVNLIRATRSASEKPQEGTKAKACPVCRTFAEPGARTCGCGYEWPVQERRAHHDVRAGRDELLAEQSPALPVDRVFYAEHAPIGRPRSLRVTYVAGGCAAQSFREWVCLEHEGYARVRAAQWWRDRLPGPVPSTVRQALVRVHKLAVPAAIRVRREGRFDAVVGYEWPEPALAQ